VRCPKCGEDNSEKFRFCGMCGTLLESAPKVGSSRPGPAPNISSAPAVPQSAVSKTAIPQTAIPQTRTALEREHEIAMRRPLVANTSSKPAASQPDRNSVPPISGPSMLGLNVPVVSRPEPSEAPLKQARFNELSANQLDENRLAQTPVRADRYTAKEAAASEFDAPRFNDLSVDSFRQTSFSGLDSYIEQEQAKSGVGRALLLLILLGALGAAGWWTYNNYRSIAQTRKAQSEAASAVEAPPESSQAKGSAASDTTPPPAAPVAKQSAPASDVAEGPSENAGPAPGTTTADNPPAQPAPAEKPAPVAKSPVVAKTPPPKKIAPKREPVMATATASKVPTPAPTDNGDSSFRKAEAYLYGRGAPQNCDEAVRNLKEASAKSNAKARSAFGTMYATGHCVPRDLPTSYLWFALALRVDPNNQILEKDLNAVWNQMTPPERQMATRMKQ
jgi:TPR repeat protein